MRITTSSTVDGTVYRIYRASDRFLAELRPLVPFVAEISRSVVFGGGVDDPNVVLLIGPLDAAKDAEFRRRIDTENGRARPESPPLRGAMLRPGR